MERDTIWKVETEVVVLAITMYKRKHLLKELVSSELHLSSSSVLSILSLSVSVPYTQMFCIQKTEFKHVV